MRKYCNLISILAITLVFIACGGSNGDSNKDSEKESVKTVTIGKQVWMAENLNVDKFRNGDPIPEAKTKEEWEQAGENEEPAWCYYNNNPDNGDRYGKLYNWYAVNDPRGLAPEGWKVPSEEEWTRLIDFLGGEKIAGKKMKSTDFWADYEGESGNGSNESGFSGFPGGFCYGGGGFTDIGESGRWWSSSMYDENKAKYVFLSYKQSHTSIENSGNYRGLDCGFSVRCVKGDSDYDESAEKALAYDFNMTDYINAMFYPRYKAEADAKIMIQYIEKYTEIAKNAAQDKKLDDKEIQELKNIGKELEDYAKEMEEKYKDDKEGKAQVDKYKEDNKAEIEKSHEEFLNAMMALYECEGADQLE